METLRPSLRTEFPKLHNLSVELGDFPEVRRALETEEPVLIEDVATHPLYADGRPTYSAVGRISRPSRFCSRMCADQPATRAQVNIGVKRSGGTSA